MMYLTTALLWLIALPLSDAAWGETPDAKVPEAETAAAKSWREPHTGLIFVGLPGGCYEMGSDATLMDGLVQRYREVTPSLAADEIPKHEVCLDPFWIAQTEVRARDWVTVMGEAPPAGSGDAPAGGISFEAAQQFARRLTQLTNGKFRFRLPTEAEWEYACRAGKEQQELPNRYNRVDIAWHSVRGNRVMQPSPVAQLKPNDWGLHDMLGNVWEWVADGYQAEGYRRHSLYNPIEKEAPNGERVIRGGSHRSEVIQLRCANRGAYPADEALSQMGLRLLRYSEEN